MPTNTLDKSSVNYLEQLFHQAAIDGEFSSEFSENPEAFGISNDVKIVLPASVEKPDQTFFELFNDALGELNQIVACASTCSASIFTIVCDGTTK
ncbi:cinnamycin family lantibiotic [Dolichospermum sp. ST_sed1]|nr:cinnamycin family lantibiotic [Dolichospermum sp. ST_sed1]MDD1427768.1 cinnamycin family lantibiotic [Dolichospermum sp. ST_sed9]MDD1430205.1 cinnamycin family lantibiotic [Dolichospermum sp. ST_sed6]MDD1443430.1 cinnamycin family lantibiotic [Dolichospermum sp. ST_sed3]MDD1446678.1 cinnamycin family lantibiotic [Dolichospermum sp. ST_sed8]MDD1454746.1 cinnamycin family lantibiotic [Dolichospermum sp. ST_sed7]MDD1463084.1 cinnamycin family lantibiotic [Dolichospermum sp. ST_sed2]MDD146739